MNRKRLWYIWAKALGNKPENLDDRDADLACIMRTVIYGVPALVIIVNGVVNVLHIVFGFWR